MHTPPGIARPSVKEALRRLLLLMLVGALIWPLFPAWAGRSLEPPFDFSRTGLALVVGVGCVFYLISAIRRRDWKTAVIEIALNTVAVAALSPALGLIIEESGNGFFTMEPLSEALAILLGAHLGVQSLRALAGAGARVRSQPQVVADEILAGIAVLMIAFWILAAMQLHFIAGTALLFAAGAYVITLLMLAPSAVIGALPSGRSTFLGS